MHRFTTLRRLGASLVAVVALTMTAAPAHASISKADATGDIDWDVWGGAAQPTSQEKARTDLTAGVWTYGTSTITARFKVRNFAHPCTTGIPCSGVTMRAMVNLADTATYTGKTAGVTVQRGFQGDYAQLGWTNNNTGNAGVACTSSGISFATSASEEWVQITVNRSCFPKGWRFRYTYLDLNYAVDNSTYTKGRNGEDLTPSREINWVPKA